MKDRIDGLISIIIPVYNRQGYISECIHSVQTQSYQNWEIILVDDGSTDGTLTICNTFAAANSNIKVLLSEHKGVSAARNIALDAACGEYIFFLDSDDIIHPLLLEVLVSAMQKYNATLGGTQVYGIPERIWQETTEKLVQSQESAETVYLTHNETINVMLSGHSALSCIGGVLMHRDLIGDTRFRTDLSIGEDFYFIYENVIKGSDCIALKQKWYYVRQHQKNSSWDYSFNGFWTRFHRRELVWISEESFGRKKYADSQKREAFYCFILCFKKNRPYSTDAKKMRKILFQYRKDLLPAHTGHSRTIYIVYYGYIFFPITITALLNFRQNLTKFLSKNKAGNKPCKDI